MNIVDRRLVIYGKDVMALTGRRRSAAYRLLREIRKNFKLTKDDLVTVKQFCSYTKLDVEDVINYLRGK